MEISNMRGKVAFVLVHAYSVVPPNSDYTSSLISLGLGYSSNLDGTIISAAFPVKYCLCSRSPLCQISKFREDFRNSYVSDSNIFLDRKRLLQTYITICQLFHSLLAPVD